MKIKLALMHSSGKIEFHDVKATMPFQVFGYTFAAHPVVNPDGTYKDPKKCGWAVTEVSSGAIAAYGDLRREAIENARMVLAVEGEERTTMAIKYALDLRRRNL
jgi:hypothetical protein